MVQGTVLVPRLERLHTLQYAKPTLSEQRAVFGGGKPFINKVVVERLEVLEHISVNFKIEAVGAGANH